MTPNNAESGNLDILLVDDLALRRAGLRRLLENWIGMSCRIIEIAAQKLTDASWPDSSPQLVVLNIGGRPAASSEVMDTISAVVRRLTGVPFIIVSDNNDHDDVVAALNAGARGFITTNLDPDIVFGALRFILGGGVFFPPDTLLRSASAASEETGDGDTGTDIPIGRDDSLTGRQIDVLNLLRQGHSNKRIAIRLGMRESTVKAHVRQIMRKLGVSNRTQAALSSMQLSVPQQADETAPAMCEPVAVEATTPSERLVRTKGVVTA